MRSSTTKIIIAVIIILFLLLLGWFFFFSSPDGGGTATFGGLFSPSSSSPRKQPPPPKQEDTGGDEIVVPPEEYEGIPAQKKTGFFDALFGFLRGDEPTFSETSGGSLGEGTAVRPPERAPSTPSLRQIVNVPVAGALAFSTGTSTSSARLVRYMERATGHIYDIDLATDKKTRVTNTTIPRVHEAVFSRNGDFVVTRYLDSDDRTVETFLGKVPKSPSGNGALRGEFLQRNISEFSLSPDTNEIFYLVKTPDGAAGFIAPLSSPAQRKQIFTFPFSEWLVQWISRQYIVLFMKPSGLVPGYTYYTDLLEAKLSGELIEVMELDEKLTGGIAGLTVLVNNSKTPSIALYSDSAPALWIYDWTDEKNTVHKRTIFQTLSEKCVWAKDTVTVYCAVPETIPSGIYPDDWYQGTVSFNDMIWSFNTKTGARTPSAEPAEYGAAIDAIKLFLSPDERRLFFTNKKDMSLWVYDI